MLNQPPGCETLICGLVLFVLWRWRGARCNSSISPNKTPFVESIWIVHIYCRESWWPATPKSLRIVARATIKPDAWDWQSPSTFWVVYVKWETFIMKLLTRTLQWFLFKMFTPNPWGKHRIWRSHMFQLGWFSPQLAFIPSGNPNRGINASILWMLDLRACHASRGGVVGWFKLQTRIPWLLVCLYVCCMCLAIVLWHLFSGDRLEPLSEKPLKNNGFWQNHRVSSAFNR